MVEHTTNPCTCAHLRGFALVYINILSDIGFGFKELNKMTVSVYLTDNLTVLVTLPFADNFPPLLLAWLREPPASRTSTFTI